MINFIPTYKWLLFGLCFLVVFTGTCCLWYQHSVSTYEQELIDSATLVLKTNTSANVQKLIEKNILTNEISRNRQNTPVSEKSSIEIPDNKQEESVPLTTQQKIKQPIQETAKVRVSPHGFGPYPDIPTDYPRQDVWDYPDIFSAGHELLLRVQIKMWHQGVKTIGGALINGKIYLNIPNTIYANWKNRVLPDGTNQKYTTRISGNPEVGQILREIIETKGELKESDIPPGVTVLDSDDSGIDPYQFLGL